MPLADFRHRVGLRVRWAEVDLQGVVFNGHYLTYFDVAVTEYWRAAGIAYPQDFHAAGTDTFVRRASLDYRAGARFDERLVIGCRVARLGTSSATMLLEIHRDAGADDLLVAGELVYVNADPVARRGVPWPEALRARFHAFEAVPIVEERRDGRPG